MKTINSPFGLISGYVSEVSSGTLNVARVSLSYETWAMQILLLNIEFVLEIQVFINRSHIFMLTSCIDVRRLQWIFCSLSFHFSLSHCTLTLSIFSVCIVFNADDSIHCFQFDFLKCSVDPISSLLIDEAWPRETLEHCWWWWCWWW